MSSLVKSLRFKEVFRHCRRVNTTRGAWDGARLPQRKVRFWLNFHDSSRGWLCGCVILFCRCRWFLLSIGCALGSTWRRWNIDKFDSHRVMAETVEGGWGGGGEGRTRSLATNRLEVIALLKMRFVLYGLWWAIVVWTDLVDWFDSTGKYELIWFRSSHNFELIHQKIDTKLTGALLNTSLSFVFLWTLLLDFMWRVTHRSCIRHSIYLLNQTKNRRKKHI